MVHMESNWNSSTGNQLLQGLNAQQAQAVQHFEGPLLILAGAGSGKTRVITHRIAWLVQVQQVKPGSILAITFTNKAAAEMKSRIEALVGPVSAAMWIGTFHSMLLRILRRHADRIGFSSHFTILDTDDQQRIIKQVCKDLSIDDKRFPIRMIHSRISAAKNDLIGYEQYTREAAADFIKEKVAQVYKMYQQTLRQNNSMDFDDILFEAVKLLEDNEDLLLFYQDRFRFILVDEYQDTNHAQYRLVHLLSARHQNLCVVGDDDQSIYSFRGANIQNILDFEKDFKRCSVIKLEQNYRSTNRVLQAANAVIRNNRGRKSKQLRTSLPEGDLITFYRGENQSEEARYVASEIMRLARAGKSVKPFGQIAILYRLNALSRNLEFALREQGVPYKIFGGTRFYDRKEIKDIMAYLRLALLPEDRLAFSRIINTPRRGIGDATLAAIDSIAVKDRLAPLQICATASCYPSLSRVSARLLQFYEQIAHFRALIDQNTLTLSELIETIEDESGLIQEIIDQQERATSDSVDRIENLKELLSDAVEFSSQYLENAAQLRENPAMRDPADPALPDESLVGILTAYLERSTLYADLDADTDQDYVRLMTIHSAKGLEFDTVFLIGAEEGLFPGYRSMETEAGIEEERRLAYVAITRARTRLIITTARTRLIFGQTQAFRVSPFVREIPEAYIEEIGGTRETFSSASQSAYGAQGYGRGFQLHSVETKAAAGGSGTSSMFRKDSPFPGAPRSSAAQNTGSMKKTDTREADGRQAVGLDPASVRRGDHVRHKKFGTGTVEQVTQVAGDAIIVVDFGSQGSKRLMVKMAPLEKINPDANER